MSKKTENKDQKALLKEVDPLTIGTSPRYARFIPVPVEPVPASTRA